MGVSAWCNVDVQKSASEESFWFPRRHYLIGNGYLNCGSPMQALGPPCLSSDVWRALCCESRGMNDQGYIDRFKKRGLDPVDTSTGGSPKELDFCKSVFNRVAVASVGTL